MLNRRDFFKSSMGLTAAMLLPCEVKEDGIGLLSRHASAKRITGIGKTKIPTGFIDFDKKTGGLKPSDLIIVAGARPIITTTFCLNIAEHTGVFGNKRVAIFSLDLSRLSIVTRMLIFMSRVGRLIYFGAIILTRNLSKTEYADLIRASRALSQSSIFIDDTPAQSILDIREKAKRLQAKEGLDLIIIDSLQLLNPVGMTERRLSHVINDVNILMPRLMNNCCLTSIGEGRCNNILKILSCKRPCVASIGESRYKSSDVIDNVSEITRSLKAIAKELKVPIVVASHLSKALDDRFDKRPRVSDLKELGAMQDADKFILIYRKEFYEDNIAPENRGTTELVIGSNRNESPDTFELSFSQLSFLPEYWRFEP